MNQTNLPLIIQQAAKAHFLDFYDQLTDGHVKVLLNNYDPDTGRQFGVLDFELAVDEVQLLCQLVGQRQFGQVPLSSDDDAGRMVRYWPYFDKTGEPRCKALVLRLEGSYRLTLHDGPARDAAGKLRPVPIQRDGKPGWVGEQIGINLKESDLIKLCMGLHDFITRYASLHPGWLTGLQRRKARPVASEAAHE